jgi:hypothetical protein
MFLCCEIAPLFGRKTPKLQAVRNLVQKYPRYNASLELYAQTTP